MTDPIDPTDPADRSVVSDSRPFWPFVSIDLGPDLDAGPRDGADPDDPDAYPTIRGRLFYRNRDLQAIEDEFGSIGRMAREAEVHPGRVTPYLLWLGLRDVKDNGGRFDELDAVLDLPGAVTWSEYAQGRVSRALSAAMGQDPDEAEARVSADVDARKADARPPVVAGALDLETPAPSSTDTDASGGNGSSPRGSSPATEVGSDNRSTPSAT